MAVESDREVFFRGAEPGRGASPYRLSRAIAEAFPDKYSLEGLSHTFDLDEHARAGRCEATPHARCRIRCSTSNGDVRRGS